MLCFLWCLVPCRAAFLSPELPTESPRGSFGDYRSVALAQVSSRLESAPSRAPKATCFCSPPLALLGLDERAGGCEPKFRSRRAWEHRCFRRRLLIACSGRLSVRVRREGAKRRLCYQAEGVPGIFGLRRETWGSRGACGRLETNTRALLPEERCLSKMHPSLLEHSPYLRT